VRVPCHWLHSIRYGCHMFMFDSFVTFLSDLLKGTTAMQASLRCKRASEPCGPLDVNPTVDTSRRFLQSLVR
jgi:hypothetical protein